MKQGETETLIEEGESTSNRFSNLVAILIACVSVIGAVIAWRVAVASSDASSADTRGLLATTDREDATTQATITSLGHQTAYTAFVRDNALSNAFYDLGGDDHRRLAQAFESAANRALDFIPRALLDRQDKFDVRRDIGENIAEFTVNRDINPQPHFNAADVARAKAQWLLFVLIWFGVALLLLTLADAIQNPLRYLCLLGGIGIFFIGTGVALLVELIGSRA
jgi:hypothetical protein